MNSFWLSNFNKTNFENLNTDVSCDVCIIGAGIFGITCSYYLAKRGLKVVVLDKSDICSRTTGHTTAKITSQHGLFYSYLIDNYGKQFAKDYLFANQDAIEDIKNIIYSENINCDFEKQSSFVYSTSISDLHLINKEVDALNSINFSSKFVTECELPFKIAGAVEFKNQAQFNPIKYVYGLLNCLLNNNGKVYTNTTVYDVKKSNNDFLTFTQNGNVKSKYVILACNYPFINFPGMYFLKMYKSLSYVIGVDTKSDLFNGMYISSSSPVYSFRTANYNGKKILLLGGLGHKTGYSKNYEESYLALENFARELYPDCDVLFRWNTCDCITLDKIPYVGLFSNFMDNFFVGTGFDKWGMTSSNVAANIICDAILKKNNKYSYVFNSSRINPFKNRSEFKNMLSESLNSLAIKKLKSSKLNIADIPFNTGGIVEINNKKIGIFKDFSRKDFCCKSCVYSFGLFTFLE